MAKERRFAEGTQVAAAKTQAECRQLIERYGGDLVSTGWRNEVNEIIGFRWRGRFYRFDVQHPPLASAEQGPKKTELTDPRDQEIHDRWAGGYYGWNYYAKREVDRRWRVLLSLILQPLFKLALEQDGIEAERVFLPYAVLPDGSTVGERIEPQLTLAYESGQMPNLALGDGS